MWPPADKSLNARLKDKVLWDVHYWVQHEVVAPDGVLEPVFTLGHGSLSEHFNAHFNNVEHSLNAKLKRYRFKSVVANKPG